MLCGDGGGHRRKLPVCGRFIANGQFVLLKVLASTTAWFWRYESAHRTAPCCEATVARYLTKSLVNINALQSSMTAPVQHQCILRLPARRGPDGWIDVRTWRRRCCRDPDGKRCDGVLVITQEECRSVARQCRQKDAGWQDPAAGCVKPIHRGPSRPRRTNGRRYEGEIAGISTPRISAL